MIGKSVTKQIIAISHEIEDESTGAVWRTYHVIEYVNIDYGYNTVTAMNGYV